MDSTNTLMGRLRAAADVLLRGPQQTPPAAISTGTVIEDAPTRENVGAIIESFFGSQKLVNRQEWLPPGFVAGLSGYGPMFAGGQSRRDDGRDPPAIESVNDIAQARELGRYLVRHHPIARGIMDTLTNFVVSDGLTYNVQSRKRGDLPDALIEDMQSVVDEFDERFSGHLDRELFERSRRDGEFFVSLHPSMDGETELRVQEPEFIIDPGSNLWTADELGIPGHKLSCSFGVVSDEEDTAKVFGYIVELGDGKLHFWDAKYVVHQKSNVDSNIKRGVSDFVPVWKWLLLQEKLLENTGESAATQAAIAYIVTHVKGTSFASVNSWREQVATACVNYQTANGSKTVFKQTNLPGTVKDIPEGQEYQPGPTGHERGTAFLEVVQGLLRVCAVRWQMGEGAVSADDSNSAYASTLVANSRFARYCRASQSPVIASYREIYLRVLEFAHAAGRFSSHNISWPELRRRIKLNVEAPAVTETNRLEDEQIRETRFRNRILSAKTWRGEAGYDDAIEQANNDDDAAKMADSRERSAAAFEQGRTYP